MDLMNATPNALLVLLVLALTAPGPLLFAQCASQPPQYPNFPGETPAKLEPAIDSFDYTRRDVMIRMRNGVRLHTVIIVPKDAKKCSYPADAYVL